ncbi:MAG: ribonuclease III [Deltaproteobacteria bacterium]|nr:ribonuclease III [Deltaproteobacteria bacterium]
MTKDDGSTPTPKRARKKEKLKTSAADEAAHEKDLAGLEKSLGHTFKDQDALRSALIHKSFVNERKLPRSEANERLEFLGDAVLELAVSQTIMESFPEYSEGQLSKLRASIVNEQKLARLARRLELGKFLYLGRGEERSGGRDKASILADGYEAVMAAVYLDGGLRAAAKMVRSHFEDALKKLPDEESDRDFKTLLQEACQARHKVTPEYRVSATTGPDHQKEFTVELSIQGNRVADGAGRTKKQAEQRAAAVAYAKLVGPDGELKRPRSARKSEGKRA